MDGSMHRGRMSIIPAMGWLALRLVATTAQAEGSQDLLTVAPKTCAKATNTVAVTPKSKAAPVPVAATTTTFAVSSGGTPPEPPKRISSALISYASSIVEPIGKPLTDYEAEVHAG